MHFVKYSTNSPEETIALDELLLVKAESGEIGETLRLWSSQSYFVVIGRGAKVKEDCFIGQCNRDNVKVIRRISGGGAVLQGPGCLNYSVILSYERDKKYKQVIKHSYSELMGNISKRFKREGYPVEFFPLSDLALEGKKVSGNAQARKRNFFLHHGTFLFDFDIAKISNYLKHPSREPEYRKGRQHKDFLTNISIEAIGLEEIVKEVFGFEDMWQPEGKDIEELNNLVLQKFSNDKWNYVF